MYRGKEKSFLKRSMQATADYPANVISLVGPSGSGKTDLICRLVAWLRARGHTVAVLKRSHKSTLAESEPARTYREAGARAVAQVGATLAHISRFQEGEPDLALILEVLAPQADVVIVEGYKQSPLPKIAFAGGGLEQVALDASRVVAWVSPEPLETTLPVFKPTEAEELAKFILEYVRIKMKG